MSDKDTTAMGDNANFLQVLLPVNRAVSLWVFLFAFTLTTLAFIAMGFIWFSEVVLELKTAGALGLYALALSAIVGAGVNGYINDDLVVSLFIAIAPLVGFGLFTVTVGAATDLSEASSTGQTAVMLGIIAAVVGTFTTTIGIWAGRKYGGKPGTEGLR